MRAVFVGFLLLQSGLGLVTKTCAQDGSDIGVTSIPGATVVTSEIGADRNGSTYLTYPALPGFRYTLRGGRDLSTRFGVISTSSGTPTGVASVGYFQIVPGEESMFYVVAAEPIPFLGGLIEVPLVVPAPVSPVGFDEVVPVPILRWSPLSPEDVASLFKPVLCHIQVFSSEDVTGNPPVFEAFAPAETFAAVESGLSPGQTYYWRVRVEFGADGLWRWSPLAKFATPSATVLPPTPVSPQISFAPDGTMSGDTNLLTAIPTFRWTGVSKANSYRIELYPEDPEAPGFPNMAGRIAANSVATNTTLEFTLPANLVLPKGKTYFWRVRSETSDPKFSLWSPFAQFHVRAL